jgi:hypothetical protein
VDYTKISLAEAIREIERVTSEANRDFGSFTPAQLNWKPAPDRWSIGECLEHLITANSLYFGIVEAILAGQYREPFLGRIPGYAGMCGRMLVKAVSPQTARKVKTMAVFEPARSTVDADEVARFTEHQGRLVDLIRKSERLDLEKTIVTSPATSMIVYTLLDAWRLIAAHEARHLGQARNVAAMDGFGA